MAEPDSREVLAQFNQLIEELLGGNLHRSTFRPWEIAILVDVVGWDVRGFSKRGNILREYQNAVQQLMQAGARVPLKVSEYMESLQVSGNPCKPADKQHATGRHSGMSPTRRRRSGDAPGAVRRSLSENVRSVVTRTIR